MPDRTPSPGMEEYKQIIAPVDITGVEGSMRKICISNDYDFLDLDAVTLHWEVVAEDVAIQEGWITDLAVAPHDSTVLTLPIASFELQANTDYYINLTVCQKEDSLFAPAGHEIKKVQIPMQIRRDEFSVREAADPLRVSDRAGILTVENSLVKARFSTVFGKLLSFGTEDRAYLTEGPRMNVYRATIDNDMYKKEDWMNKYFSAETGRRDCVCQLGGRSR
ncbi:MAG: beta-galactosidase domain 4-containing protein [Eubacterium sp.]